MRLFLPVLASLAFVPLLAPPTAAAPRPQVDALEAAPATAGNAVADRLRTRPALRALGTVSQLDTRFGVPTFLWATPGTDRPAAASSATRRATAAEASRDHLRRVAPLYALTTADVDGAELRNVHDTGRGGVIASYRQVVNGVEVFRDEIKLLMNRDLDLVAVSGFIPGRGAAGKTGPRAFRMSAAEAIGRALADFTGGTTVPVRRTGSLEGGYDAFAPTDPAATVAQPIRSKQVYFHTPGALEPGYYVELANEYEAYGYVVSAVDGTVLFRKNLIAQDVFNYRAWADAGGAHLPYDGPQGTSGSPHPTGLPDYYIPPFVAPPLVALQNGPISTNDPWLPPGATVTTGNNVDAYADLTTPDGYNAGDVRATTTAPGTFDHTYDTGLAPDANATQRMASAVNVFYVNNYLHDLFYDAGFDESAGNAQNSNYGRGGIQGDRILGQTQDYSGTNNANMYTPPDGQSPRMQMYVFTATGGGSVEVTSPALGPLPSGVAEFGPQVFSVSGALVLASDGVGTSTDACEAIANDVSGKIVLVDRGSCTFVIKATNAQNAGAIGIIIANNQAGVGPMGMAGVAALAIPVLSVSKEDGDLLKTELGGGPVTVSMTRVFEPARDGGLDNQVVAHEWGHYLSNRLIGDANGISTQQSWGMGEGWGDFTALMLTVRPEDAVAPANTDFSGVYNVGGYAVGQTTGASNAYYFAIRRLPYSTNFAKNALTFKHIENGVALPVGPPTSFGADGSSNAEVHNTGEVWCTMLWECYVELLKDTGRLTFQQAHDRMRDYLIAGLMLTPNAPTFTEARDAMLAAALSNDLADFTAFWAAFARRGIGVGAIPPDRFSDTNAGVVESFDVGGDLAFVSASLDDDIASCDADGYIDDGESGHLTVTLRNSGATSLSATTATVSSTNPAVSFPNGNTLVFPATTPNVNTLASIPVAVQGAVGIEALDFDIQYDDPGLFVAGPRAAGLDTPGNGDVTPGTTETVEALPETWTFSGSGGDPWSRLTLTALDHRFFVPDAPEVADQSLVSPPLQVAASGSFTFSFKHAHSFEQSSGTFWDGGVIEITTNGGGAWTDIGASASPGYGGVLSSIASNPLGGRSAYVSQSAFYPALQTVTVDLGTAYQGQTVQVRFRMGADLNTPDIGWEIDDLVFNNILNQPFLALIAEADPCAAVAVGDPLPVDLAFALAGGNPVTGPARFRLALPSAARVDVSVFDVSGRRVGTLADGELGAGVHTLVWDGPGRDGRAGVYFARMTTAGRAITAKVLLVP